ncbi:amidohydrolase family protein [Streptomyces sp. NPDC088252]|uniref:amidohydrolase family protein n=1 Tax=unclassified Streptomyces TaxID=2593676 RepID=UPI003431880F
MTVIAELKHCDIVFRGATITNCTGAPRFTADVATDDDRISAVGDLGAVAADEDAPAAGRVLAPGFIDTHAHDDQALFAEPDMAMKVSQGVTTVVIGNCGIGLAPLRIGSPPPPPFTLLGGPEVFSYPTMESYLRELTERAPAVDVGCLVGHSTLRLGAMDDLTRPATPVEAAEMRERMREAMTTGAIGLSSGVWYPLAAAAPPR